MLIGLEKYLAGIYDDFDFDGFKTKVIYKAGQVNYIF